MSVWFPKGVWPPKPERAYGEDEDAPRRVWCLVGVYERDRSYSSPSGGQYRHLKFHLVSIPDSGRPSLDNARNEIDTIYYDLEISSQGDQYSPDRLYGFDLHYTRVHSIDGRRAKIMARAFDTIERKLAVIEKKEGRPPYEDYSAYLCRLVRVLGVKVLALPQSDRSAEVSGEKYTFVRTDDMTEVQNRLHTCIYQLWTENDREIAKQQQAIREAVKAQEAANG